MKHIFLITTIFIATFSPPIFAGSATAPHHTSTVVTIINNTNDNYLFVSGDLTGPDEFINQRQNAISNLQTNNAFVVEKSSGMAGVAPSGSFIYKNQIDGSICQFNFDDNGVSLIQQNGHCSITSNSTDSSWGIPYSWKATITLS